MRRWRVFHDPGGPGGGEAGSYGLGAIGVVSQWGRRLQEYRKSREKEKQDLDVYQALSNGARPTIEYYVLTVLSCILATTGLIQGSGAVIIGAMIVAPLMTPILAFSLAVIWGDLTLLRDSFLSLLRGVLLAVVISAVIALLVPISAVSAEIVSRTRPSLFDIIVALVAGVVGAYGHANKKISNTIVGIAIAVALMPPLCTAGIELGKQNWSGAGGAAVLFAINLVSISLAGSVIFLLMRIHPRSEDTNNVKRRALYQIVLSAVVLAAIAVPVGVYMRTGYVVEKSQQTASSIVSTVIPGAAVFSSETRPQAGRYLLTLTLIGEQEPNAAEVQALRDQIGIRCPIFDRTDVRFLQERILGGG